VQPRRQHPSSMCITSINDHDTPIRASWGGIASSALKGRSRFWPKALDRERHDSQSGDRLLTQCFLAVATSTDVRPARQACGHAWDKLPRMWQFDTDRRTPLPSDPCPRLDACAGDRFPWPVPGRKTVTQLMRMSSDTTCAGTRVARKRTSERVVVTSAGAHLAICARHKHDHVQSRLKIDLTPPEALSSTGTAQQARIRNPQSAACGRGIAPLAGRSSIFLWCGSRVGACGTSFDRSPGGVRRDQARYRDVMPELSMP
jgi:hypothetical protein